MLTIWDEIELVLPAVELDEVRDVTCDKSRFTRWSLGKAEFFLQVKRIICRQQVDENQDLRDEYVALLEMSSSLQQQTEVWNQQHSLFQTPERSLVQYLLKQQEPLSAVMTPLHGSWHLLPP